MATNSFLPFASGADANVLTDAQYQSDLASGGTYADGVVSGQASSAQANKVWRQSTAMSSALGQVIVDILSEDANDSLTTAELAQLLIEAFSGGTLLATTVFPAGSSTWTPNPLTTKARYRLCAPGGSGGGAPALASSATTACASTGGGGGSYEEGIMTFSRGALSAGIAIYVGTGGASPTAGQNDGNPGIHSYIGGRVAPGGPGGLAGQPYTPPFAVSLGTVAGLPSGAIASGVTLQTLIADPGGAAGSGFAMNTGNILPGPGGSSLIGHGGVFGGSGGVSAGAQAYGGGGSGTATEPGGAATSGGAGAVGYIQIDEYL